MNERYNKGIETLRKVDPVMADGLSDWLGDLFPDLARLTIEFGYGDVMSRDGLDLPTRELITIAMLGAMGTANQQLEMHIDSALNVGLPLEQILEAVLQIAAYAGFPAAYNTITAVKKVLQSRAATQ